MRDNCATIDSRPRRFPAAPTGAFRHTSRPDDRATKRFSNARARMPRNEEQAADLLDGYLQRAAEETARVGEAARVPV